MNAHNTKLSGHKAEEIARESILHEWFMHVIPAVRTCRMFLEGFQSPRFALTATLIPNKGNYETYLERERREHVDFIEKYHGEPSLIEFFLKSVGGEHLKELFVLDLMQLNDVENSKLKDTENPRYPGQISPPLSPNDQEVKRAQSEGKELIGVG